MDKIVMDISGTKKARREFEKLERMKIMAEAFNLTKESFRDYSDGQFIISIPVLGGGKLELVIDHKGNLLQTLAKSTESNSFTMNNRFLKEHYGL